MKSALPILAALFFIVNNTNAQLCTSYRVENLNQVGSDIFFDLYINTTTNDVLHLGNSDFLLTYNSSTFTNPTFTNESFIDPNSGLQTGYCTLKPTNQSGSNIPLLRSIYHQNTSTDFVMGDLIINVYGTAPSNQGAFDLSVAIVDGSMVDHRLGRFKLTGFSGTSVEDAQIQLKSTPGLFETTVFHVENDGLNFLETQVACSSLFNITLKANLEGPYDEANDIMVTTLNLRDGSPAHRGLLPGQAPLNGGATPTPMGQPYSVAPWNYLGTEGVGVTDYPESVVDWVLISLRTDDLSTSIWRSAGWINEDGSVSMLSLPDPQVLNESSVNVVIQHRNHFGVCTPVKLDISTGLPVRFDFTTNQSRVLGVGQKQLANGKYVMYVGDANQATDAPIGQDINGNDNAQIVNENGFFDLYSPSDLNFSGDVTGADRARWNANNGNFKALPK